MSLYSKITDNKYFVISQRAGVMLGSYFIIKLLAEEYVLPITVFGEVLGISFFLFAYIYLLKSYWADNDYVFRKGSYAGIIYAIIGIPFALTVVVLLMITCGWATIPMKSYQGYYDNAFDRIVIVYISPIVSIIVVGSSVISMM
jgi:hypothetical protein